MDRLTSRIHDLEEQIAIFDIQHKAQAQETKAVKEVLTEASMELEASSSQYCYIVYYNDIHSSVLTHVLSI